MEDRPLNVPEHIAVAPYSQGYRMQPGDVLVLGLDENEVAGPRSAVSAEGLSGSELATMVDDEVLPMFGEDYRNVAVVRWDNEDEEDPTAFHDELAKRLQGNEEGFRISQRYRVDEHDDLYVSGTGTPSDDQQYGQDWEHFDQLPDIELEMWDLGYDRPAATKKEFLARFAPESEPGFAPLREAKPEVAERLDGMCPSQQVEAARFCVDRLASTDHRKGDLEELGGSVAHLVSQNKAVRDAVVAHAATSEERTGALVSVYRLTPEEQRPAMAAAAGAAWTCRGNSHNGAQQMFAHAQRDPEQAKLGQLMTTASLRAHLTPEQQRELMHRGSAEEIAQADARWEKTLRPEQDTTASLNIPGQDTSPSRAGADIG